MRNFLFTWNFRLMDFDVSIKTDHRRRQGFDWFLCRGPGRYYTVEIIVWLVQGKYGPSVFRSLPRIRSPGNVNNPVCHPARCA